MKYNFKILYKNENNEIITHELDLNFESEFLFKTELSNIIKNGFIIGSNDDIVCIPPNRLIKINAKKL